MTQQTGFKTLIQQGMLVLCDRGILRGIVQHAEGEHLQVTLNASGEQVWLPISSVREVETDVHLHWSKQDLLSRAQRGQPLQG